MECFGHHLREEGGTLINPDAFTSVGLYFGDEDNCKELVSQTLFDAFKNKEDRFTKRNLATSCVINRLRDHDIYKLFILQSIVLDYSKISWTFWKYFEVRHQLEQTHLGMQLIEESEIIKCENRSYQDDDEDDDDDEGEGSGSRRDEDVKAFRDDSLVQSHVDCRKMSDQSQAESSDSIGDDDLVFKRCLNVTKASKKDDELYFEE